MRLTERQEIGGYQTEFLSDSIQKLGQLEDIEEELGIDLITLFEALKNGIYFKVVDKLYFTDNLNLDFDQKCLFEIIPPDDAEAYYLDDYGENWALTKEELENDNTL